MPNQKFGNKGVEPFVADILLVIIGITIAAILLNYSGGFIGARLQQTSSALDCTSAELSVTDVYLSGNAASVIVRNTGRSAVALSSAKLFHKSGPEGIATTEFPLVVPVSSLRAVEFVGAPICGNFDSVQVFTTCPDLVVRYSGSPKCS
jgi:hypothetical protein